MRWMILSILVALPGLALADPVDGQTARKLVFSTRVETVILPESGLSAADQATLKVLFRQQSFPYYGAVAISPGDGLVAEPSNIAQNLHSPAAADAQALAACNKLRKASTPCIVVAHVLPRGWKPRPLMLNTSATEGMKLYRKGSGPKAMAISRSTDVWSVARGFGAGVAARNECRRQAAAKGADDCEVVIRDE